ncbi:hypothetical protein BH09PSE5_BH09PSE5_20120 [soil metagenome]
MNAPLYAYALSCAEPGSQADLSLETDGVLRYVWESRFGPMLIEVVDGQAFVNGQAVTPASTSAASVVASTDTKTQSVPTPIKPPAR